MTRHQALPILSCQVVREFDTGMSVVQLRYEEPDKDNVLVAYLKPGDMSRTSAAVMLRVMADKIEKLK